jgi:quercetin dioxygenase-like cupin family protein
VRAGDVGVVPRGLVHWHGALAGHLFAHISFVATDSPDNTTWREPVDEARNRPAAAAEG